MNLTHPFLDADGDKLREECGVFGVIGTKEAAAMAALGLHALQHRGQEAVGIVSWDGKEFFRSEPVLKALSPAPVMIATQISSSLRKRRQAACISLRISMSKLL